MNVCRGAASNSGAPVVSLLPRALLVEDDPVFAGLVEAMLRESEPRFTLERVTELDAGVRRVLAGGIDVVLLDLGLPDSEGLDSVSTVHLFDTAVPIVVLTGLDDAEAAVQAVREGAQDYLVKGRFDAERLVRTMTFAVERAGAAETADA